MKFVSHIIIITCFVFWGCGSVRHNIREHDQCKADREYYKARNLVLMELVKRYRHEPCANFQFDTLIFKGVGYNYDLVHRVQIVGDSIIVLPSPRYKKPDIEIIRRKDW